MAYIKKIQLPDGTVYDLPSGGGGTPTTVKVDGTSITSNDEADILTMNSNYNASSNKLATASDLPTVILWED